MVRERDRAVQSTCGQPYEICRSRPDHSDSLYLRGELPSERYSADVLLGRVRPNCIITNEIDQDSPGLRQSRLVPDLTDVAVTPHSSRVIPAHQVLALYRAQGWWPERNAEQVTAALNCGPAVAAWHRDHLVGFARAVTDGVLRAYLEDVVVAPEFRDAGLGRALVAAIVDLLQPVPVISLFCSTDLVAYYQESGFHPTKQVVLHRT